MKIATRTLFLSCLLPIAAGAKAEPQEPNNQMAGPYYAQGLKIGSALGKSRGEHFECNEKSLIEASSFEFSDDDPQPYLAGFIEGFSNTYEKARLLKIGECANANLKSNFQVSKDLFQEIKPASEHLQRLQNKLQETISRLKEEGCEWKNQRFDCTPLGKVEIPQDYYQTFLTVADDDYFQKFTLTADFVNKVEKQRTKESNQSIRAELDGLLKKDQLSTNDIKLIQELSKKLQSPTIVENLKF